MTPDVVSFETIIVPLSAAAGLSVTIERILEFLKNILEPFPGSDHVPKIPRLSQAVRIINKIKARYEEEEFKQKAEHMVKDLKNRFRKESNSLKRKVLYEMIVELENETECSERFSFATILVEPATEPNRDKISKMFMLQLLGFAMGILFARAAGVQLFSTLLGADYFIPLWFDYLLTGLFIGGGSGPAHTLIRFITQRKITASASPLSVEEESPIKIPQIKKTPVIISVLPEPGADTWTDIPYLGGVDKEKLEYVHRRRSNPNMVVYHHTAMPSRSTFEDVIRVIKSHTDSKGRPWITGYNCVVTADGMVHPFCRWDRYGIHAAGYNSRSLGLAFNGNYETNPDVPCSNSNGRMGQHVPPEKQLKSAARLVTLWSFLYDIDLNFENKIIPHKLISSKACPGSSFPYEDFKRWINFYRKKWEQSDTVQEKIEAYKLKPYLYV